MADTPYCSDIARQTDEQLAGTTPHIQVWLLLEHAGPWRAKAIVDNDLPRPVQAWLAAQLDDIPLSQALFIRRHPGDQATMRRFYVAVTDPVTPRLYAFDWRNWAELSALNVAAIIDAGAPANEISGPLVTVCTNGKRDRCCARLGRPVFEAFRAEAGFEAWQCTHVGGHRFAATAVVWPQAVYYGYMTPATVPDIAAAVKAGRLVLPHFRGRTYYGGAGSAAEYFLRRAAGLDGERDLRLIAMEHSGDVWRVTFMTADGRGHDVTVVEEHSPPLLASCDKALKPQVRFRLVDLRAAALVG